MYYLLFSYDNVIMILLLLSFEIRQSSIDIRPSGIEYRGWLFQFLFRSLKCLSLRKIVPSFGSIFQRTQIPLTWPFVNFVEKPINDLMVQLTCWTIWRGNILRYYMVVICDNRMNMIQIYQVSHTYLDFDMS